MTSTNAPTVATPCLLPPAAADAVLRSAVERHARTNVRPVHRDDAGGVVLALAVRDTRGLRGRVAIADESDRDVLFASRLTADLMLDDVSYTFSTRCLEIHLNDAEADVLLEHPTAVYVVQRRQARRYQLQRPGRVSLWIANDPEAGPFEGAVLNLSAGGLACRSSSYVGSLLAPGRMIRVEFAVGEPARTYVVLSRVVGVTPGGSENTTIINLEFQTADDSQTAAVQAVLSELTNA